MALENRLKTFHEQVVAKNLVQAKQLSYNASFLRLFFTRRAAEFIFSALLVFGGHQFIILNQFFSSIWPAAGVALSAVFLRGNNLLCSIFIGTLSSYLYNHFPWELSLYLALIFTLFIFLVRQGSLKFIGTITPLCDLNTLWKFIALIGVLCAIHISSMTMIFITYYKSSFSTFSWYCAWLGELNGILALTPLCLIFDPFVPQKYFNKKNNAWWFSGFMIFACYFLFFLTPSGLPSIILSVIFLIMLGVYAKIFGQIPTCTTLFALSVVYLTGVLPHSHLFHKNSSHQDVMILLSLFSLTAIVSISISTFKQQKYYASYRV